MRGALRAVADLVLEPFHLLWPAVAGGLFVGVILGALALVADLVERFSR